MHLGVVPLLDGDSGGVYQYCLSILRALRQPGTLSADDKVTVFVHDPGSPQVQCYCDPGWTVRPLSPPSLRRSASKAVYRVPGMKKAIALLRSSTRQESPQRNRDPDDPSRNQRLGQWFRKSGVDVMLYPVPMSIAFESGVPFIFTVHDLQHRLQPHFKEVGAPQEWGAREYLFRNGTREALLVVADSDIGREDVLSCYGAYGVKAERVHALPFLPADYLPHAVPQEILEKVRKRFSLPERYFFYPAQFWPHKNHERLVEAIAQLRSRMGIDAPLALCGSHNNAVRRETFDRVMALAQQLGVGDLVRYLGFVSEDDMPGLYAGATALVMPTFFGPTNIPILEAWALGCPVMTSDIRGVREQAGDAAALVDPGSTEAMAEAMARLWRDDGYCTQLRNKGFERLSLWKPEDFASRLSAILSQARELAVRT